MSGLAELATALRENGGPLALDAIPYAGRLGVTAGRDGDALVLTLPFSEALIGAPSRLHGGVLAGLLELAAVLTVLRGLPAGEAPPRLKPVTVTTDFLREGAPVDTYASASAVRLGRRVANLRATAWQADRDKPIAAATMTVLLARDQV